MHNQNKGVRMVAFVLCSLSVMALGWFGLRLSAIADFHAKRRMTVRWYDHISTALMIGGALCAAGGQIVLAWKLLP